MAIQKVKAFKTSDGRIFENEAEAKQAERVNEFADFYSSTDCIWGSGLSGKVDSEALFEFIRDHYMKIKEIMEKY